MRQAVACRAMEESLFIDVVLPLSLVVIMTGLGMALTGRDFKRIVLHPRAALVGLGNQLVLLPLVGYAVAVLFGLPPLWAVGLMLIAACPGGPTSNMITFVARGDTALSISLTAVSSAVTVVTIPAILAFSISHFGVDAETIRSPVGEIVLQIVAITAVPVTVGLLVRRWRPGFAARMERPVRLGSAALFVLVLAAVIVEQRQVIYDHFLALSGATGVLNVATMALGFVMARAASLDMRRTLTIAIESGIQNGTLAIVIAMSILGVGEVAVPPGVYSLLMFITGGAVMYYFGAVTAPAERDEEPAPSGEIGR